MTTQIQTLQMELNAANPNTLADALKKVAIGDLIAALVTEQADVGLVVASNAITLSKTPLPGTLRITAVVDGGTAVVLQEQLPGTSAILVNCFKLSGKTVTLKSAGGSQFADGVLLSASYVSLDSFPTAAELAAQFANV